MRLLYSDGQNTVDAWDSAEQDGALPVAIEVQLTLRSSDEEADGGESYRRYRMVVAMPTANPAAAAAEGQQSGAGNGGAGSASGGAGSGGAGAGGQGGSGLGGSGLGGSGLGGGGFGGLGGGQAGGR